MSVKPRTLTLGVAQSHTRSTTASTLQQLSSLARKASARSVQLLLFPEAYLGGYPRTCGFGSSIGARTDEGRSQFLHHFDSAIDLGDTPSGAGDAWVERTLEISKGTKYRGDGTREELETIARESGVFLVVGVIEKAGGSLYCAVLYVCPVAGCIGKRRKVMPTGTERSIWAQGSTSTLKAVRTVLNGVEITLAAAICWENFMPLLRFSLYSQSVNVYLAPTADARATWLPLLQTIANEGRCFVLSSNQCVLRRDLPDWMSHTSNEPSVPNAKGTSRRKSVITKTADNHEIVTCIQDTVEAHSKPAANNSATSRRKSVTMHIPDDHEISWPTDSKLSKSPEIFRLPTLDFSKPPIPRQLPTAKRAVAIRKSSSTVDPVSTKAEESSAISEESADDTGADFVCKGGSCIVSPYGEVLAGPLWETTDSIITATVDFNDIVRSKLDFDVAGHYSRADSFELKVKGLDLNPPP